MRLILVILALVVSKPADSITRPVYLPGDQGVIVVEWKPSLHPSNPSKPRLLFNHFVSHPAMLFGVHYDSYHLPVVRLSLGATHHLRSRPVLFDRGRRYVIAAFWRRVGSTLEAGILVNGYWAGHLWEPARHFNSWKAETRIGARNLESVSDPTFPSVQHADGEISVWVFS